MNRAPLRVLHVVENLDVGGLERVVVDLVRGARRVETGVACLGDGGALASEVRAAGRPLWAMERRRGVDWFLLFRLARIARSFGAHVVHCHNRGPLVYGAPAARLAGGARVVFTAHGARTAGRPHAARWRRLGLVDRVVCVSDDAARIAIEGAGLDPSIVEVIPNGIDVSRFDAPVDRVQVRSRLGIPADARVAGIVARLTPAKAHEVLLEAFDRLAIERDDAWLVVVGDGECRDAVREHAERLRSRERVVLAGERRDVPSVLAAMDVFVLSSRTEGLAVTLLEAMAARLPVVATRVGGNAEVVVDGETGRLVPPGDPPALARAIAEVLDDAPRARAMGEAGRRRVEARFSVAAMVERYETIYASLVGAERTKA